MGQRPAPAQRPWPWPRPPRVRGGTVGADDVGVLLGDRRAAHHDDDLVASRRPACCSALRLALNIGMVVVRKAEKTTMSGLVLGGYAR